MNKVQRGSAKCPAPSRTTDADEALADAVAGINATAAGLSGESVADAGSSLTSLPNGLLQR